MISLQDEDKNLRMGIPKANTTKQRYNEAPHSSHLTSIKKYKPQTKQNYSPGKSADKSQTHRSHSKIHNHSNELSQLNSIKKVSKVYHISLNKGKTNLKNLKMKKEHTTRSAFQKSILTEMMTSNFIKDFESKLSTGKILNTAREAKHESKLKLVKERTGRQVSAHKRLSSKYNLKKKSTKNFISSLKVSYLKNQNR